MDTNNFSRRDFLYLMSLFSASLPLGKFSMRENVKNKGDKNIFIFVFDTLSAEHMSLYGYQRETTPHLAEFSSSTNVYHHHYAGGNFTPSGTASLLTGTYPWSNRCTSVRPQVLDHLVGNNIFSVLGVNYNTFAYTQNYFAYTLLTQFKHYLQQFPHIDQPGTYHYFPKDVVFTKDENVRFWARMVMYEILTSPSSTPIFSLLSKEYFEYMTNKKLFSSQNQYPFGSHCYFPGVCSFIDEAMNWLKSQIVNLYKPSLGYFHMMAPHFPYSPHERFASIFKDNYLPPSKNKHLFSESYNSKNLLFNRTIYDRFIANVDYEFGKMISFLKKNGLYENSYIVLTSDHGELFERGIWGHMTRVLYEGLTHIPLLIKKPGQKKRRDIFETTSAVDILPTLCFISEILIPDWVEGRVLPGFGNNEANSERSVYTIEMKENGKFLPLTKGTVAQVKWPYKLIYYTGYNELDYHFEMYDLHDDPDELNDIYNSKPKILDSLQDELLSKIEEMNKPFLS